MKTIYSHLKALLGNERLRIADVGSTGGAELRWKPFNHFCYYYTFDPDPRAQEWEGETENFRIGLWSEACTKELKTFEISPCDFSLCPCKRTAEPFAQSDCFSQVGTEDVALDSLDQLLQGRPVDFIKVDAEGAELEILKGAKKTIRSNCLALQIETYFYQVREGAPTFAEIDALMRKWGFQLFHLKREHWVRKTKSIFPNPHHNSFGQMPSIFCRKKAFGIGRYTDLCPLSHHLTRLPVV
jgi:methyltransferase, FkbM family